MEARNGSWGARAASAGARLPERWEMARADPQERGSYSWLEGPCETLGLPLGKTAVMPSTR